jgi:hypothetical protein
VAKILAIFSPADPAAAGHVVLVVVLFAADRTVVAVLATEARKTRSKNNFILIVRQLAF